MLYSLAHYGSMIADHIRVGAYAEALRRAVAPGSTVAEIGTGSGVLALLACRFGARRVYAIESDDVIQVAREVARANDCADRIEFIEDRSTRASLPERVDVIVADIRGALPPFKGSVHAMADARRRFLRPGGTLVPQRDVLWVAPVEAPEVYKRRLSPWADNPCGLDMRPVVRIVTNTWGAGRVRRDQLLGSPHMWASLDYMTVEDLHVSGRATWKAERAGTFHGLSVWFEAHLADGVRFTTGPDGPETIYGSPFFPLAEPVAVAPGDTIEVALRAVPGGEDYVWYWHTRVFSPADPLRPKASFTQSEFFATLLSADQIRKRSATHVAALNEDGRIAHLILNLVDGGACHGDIATRLVERFPERFARWEDALGHTGDMAARYSR